MRGTFDNEIRGALAAGKQPFAGKKGGASPFAGKSKSAKTPPLDGIEDSGNTGPALNDKQAKGFRKNGVKPKKAAPNFNQINRRAGV